MHVEETTLIQQAAENGRIKILDANYSQADRAEHLATTKLDNLTTNEKTVVFNTFKNYQVLFSGGQGRRRLNLFI
jgi:hypothetical protein